MQRASGEEHLRKTIAALSNGHADVRSSAAEKLGKQGDVRAVEPLLHALEDQDHVVRASAAKALAELQDTRAVVPLCEKLTDHDTIVRWRAVEALGKLQDARAIVPLCVLSERPWFVRRNMARPALAKTTNGLRPAT